MNHELLEEIQKVEAKHGSLSNPKADLSKVHTIIKDLGMSRCKPGRKHVRSKELVLE